MSEPSLEQIAAMSERTGVPSVNRDRLLAREIIVLREVVQINAERVGAIRSESTEIVYAMNLRIRALESQARPFQEDGELAVGREGDERAECWEACFQRDAAIARADEAERERDEYREMCGRISAQCDELAESRVERNAEIERLREALRKIVATPSGEFFGDPGDRAYDLNGFRMVVTIAQAALDGSGQHE